jgi:alkyl hydroperoxide reductase subunit AhpC
LPKYKSIPVSVGTDDAHQIHAAWRNSNDMKIELAALIYTLDMQDMKQDMQHRYDVCSMNLLHGHAAVT